MAHARNLINKQMELYMSNWQYALLYTLILAVLPFTSWLAVVGIAFLTLRKGFKSGIVVLLPVSCVVYAVSLKSLSYFGAFINTVVLFLPCFIGALVLRVTSTWQAVTGIFFFLIAVCALMVQAFAPSFITSQYAYLESVVQQSQADAVIIKLFADLASIDKSIVASYVFGLQLLSIFMSAFIALMFARALQSKMFNVGGFKQEALSFRAHKVAIFILLALFLGVNKQNVVAMMLLPAVCIYFLLAGVSICAGIVNKKRPRLMFVLLIPILILPVVGVPFYSFLGLFDSLFSLRFYTLKRRNRG